MAYRQNQIPSSKTLATRLPYLRSYGMDNALKPSIPGKMPAGRAVHRPETSSNATSFHNSPPLSPATPFHPISSGPNSASKPYRQKQIPSSQP